MANPYMESLQAHLVSVGDEVGPEPNNAGGPEDCLELGHYASARDQWNDWNCGNKIPFLCKYSLL